MVAKLRSLFLALIALSLVGYQTACACAHEAELPTETAAHSHCDEMAADMPMPSHEDKLALPCERASSDFGTDACLISTGLRS